MHENCARCGELKKTKQQKKQHTPTLIFTDKYKQIRQIKSYIFIKIAVHVKGTVKLYLQTVETVSRRHSIARPNL